ncbi:hypothetical protein [Plebeiibacterium marinum]|uniref:Uncharacterized protein n=1 Tax=Plebeiibacterium marinum TaxID=2992111 RepID=A0AAE3SJH3_9BACT|nr:hypothetical protein [Plebeiobacterium marinum]MCW3805745.1 hypothetical protein [Plebeiobacterium marinum]
MSSTNQINISSISDFSPNNSIKHLWRYKHPIDASNSKNPTLNEITIHFSYEIAIALIGSWLNLANQMVNIKRCLSKDAINYISLIILKDHGNLKIDEFALIIISISKAENGSFYQSLSSEYVFDAIRKHETRKSALLESKKEITTLNDRLFFIARNIDKLPSVIALQKKLGRK